MFLILQMKRMKIILTLSAALAVLVSCDCYQQISGTIVDKNTGKPLKGVSVYNIQKDRIKTITDSTGHFELSAISGGFRCPPMKVAVQAENYKIIKD